MMHHIYYRLPEEKVVHELHSHHVVELEDLAALGKQPGYIFVPFRTDGERPTLLFLPDTEISWIVPNRFSARHLDYSSDENQRRQRYTQEFNTCIDQLKRETVRKIVLSRGLRLQMDSNLDEEDRRNLFITACHHYPHSYVALVEISAEESWLIATPEVLLEEKEGTLRTMALAATMSIEEGGHLKPSQWSSKNREEQHIVADYIGQRLQELGISYSSSAVHTKIAGQLVHLCTDFSMEATAEIGPIVAALHPTPAVCGLPTQKAADLLLEIEHHQRQYYAGFSGPVNLEAGTHLFVTLRCMQITHHQAHLFAGGGLLAASDCESEWIETQRKLKTMLNVLQ